MTGFDYILERCRDFFPEDAVTLLPPPAPVATGTLPPDLNADELFAGRPVTSVSARSTTVEIPIRHCCRVGAVLQVKSSRQQSLAQDAVLLQALVEQLLLAFENGSLAQVEHEARLRAEQAVRARDDLLAGVAHDLRNPLAAIIAGGFVLDRLVLPDHGTRVVQAVRAAAQRMKRLTDDLLDLGRLESSCSYLILAPVPLNALLEQVSDQAATIAESRHLHLTLRPLAPDAAARCDRDRVLQVIENLVCNALKFTPPGGSVELSAANTAEHVEISVRDTGPGIESGALAHIFDRYWQQSRGAASGGVGLGLSLASAIVTAHGGLMRVTSTLGQGSAFTFTLPRADRPQSGRQEPVPRGKPDEVARRMQG